MTAPARFGKFELLGELGKGAMGTVYRARDPVLDRLLALKTISPSLLAKQEALSRFQREARAVARLQHPAIVTIYELGEVEGTRYIAMELVEGLELSDALAQPPLPSLQRKVDLVVGVCRGLDFAHKMGVVHRDVKPSNIRVTRDGSVKILDFGVAWLGESDITHSGIVLGTPSYVSPELLQGARVDHHADMWAVAVIAYEMLAGRRPFEAPTIASLVNSIVHDPVPPLDAAALHVPKPLAAAVMRALDKDPAGRFPDCAALAHALLKAIGAPTTAEAPLDAIVRKRAYDANFAEARRRLTEHDLSGALDAARRAQGLDPSRTGIVGLIRVIEDRISQARTAPRPLPDEEELQAGKPAADATTRRRAIAPQAVTATGPPAPARPPSAAIPAEPLLPGPLDTTTLRGRGAAAFRDQGVFGESVPTNDATLSPVADVLALAGADGAVRFWDLPTRTRATVLRTELHRRSGHDAAAVAIAFSPDGSLLASAHVDGTVHLWDVAKAEEIPVRLRHEQAVQTLAFSPDGSTLATGSLDANLRLWDVGAALAGEARRELLRQPSPVTALIWTAGGEWILTGHASRVLRLTDPQRGRLLATLRGPEGRVNLILLAPDCQHLAVASHDKTVRIYDLATREVAVTLGPVRRAVSGLCFLADGGFLATVSQDNSVQLWDLDIRSSVTALWGPAQESFVTVVLYGDSNHLAAALADGRIRLWGPAV
jgi:eukaryotic-like serine/threonine-protein kinase